MSGRIAGSATLDAAARIARLRAQNPNAAVLARLLSLAVPIEPALMRAMRLKLLPRADVSAEADLWFSPLIETRSREGIMLLPAVAEELRKSLGNDESPPAHAASEPTLAERCWDVTRKLHDYLPPAVQLKEQLNFLSLDSKRHEAEIKDLIKSALFALIRDQREEVANWAGRALPRLPQAVRDSDQGHMLAAASDLRLGRSMRAPYLADGKPIPDWFRTVLPSNAEKVDLGVRLAGSMLVLDRTPDPTAQHIMVPATDPRVVQLHEPGSGREPRIVFIETDAAESVPLFGRGEIELSTLAGEVYTLERIPGRGHPAVSSLACVAYANCNQVLLAWQLSALQKGLIGFELQRIDAGGEVEVMRNGLGFTRLTAQVRLPTSDLAPIQHFVWIDRPPKRGATYRYRITPLVGKPSKIEPVGSLQARTAEVAVAVTPHGPLKALFNTAMSAARREWRVKDGPAEVRAFLGGEVRRTLLEMLERALTSEVDSVYVALSRLDDPDLIEALARLGRRANVVLGAARMGRDAGPVEDLRRALSGTTVHLRSRAPGYAHSHFMVVCDRAARPRAVWSSSISWTIGSLYGRDSNGLVNACSPTRSFSTKRDISSNTSMSKVIAARRTSFDGGPFGRSRAFHGMR